MKVRAKQIIDGLLGGILVFFNLLLARPLGLLLRRDHTLRLPPDNIVVIKMLGLGSLLLASDAIYSLKKKYPKAKLVLICGKGVAPGIVPTGLFDEVWATDDKNIFVLAQSSLQILFKTWQLKNKWVVDFEVYSKLTTIYSLWTFAINRFGFQLQKVHFRNFLNTHNSYFNQFCNVQDNYRSLVKMMGVETITEFSIPVASNPGRQQENELKYIAINNTCSDFGGYLRKITPPTLSQICRLIIEKTPYSIAFTGAPSDVDDINSFIENYLNNDAERIENIAGKYSFANYYSFLHNECAMMLTVDSAPLFIALKTGLPTVSVWGPTNPTHRLSAELINSPRHAIHYLGVECSPCLHHTTVLPCGGNNFCMKNMLATDIFTKIEGVINHLQHHGATAK